ncbi:MAG: four helix bundle protein [Polyangiaceae bacterium]|nr:four helix bundle protein [Polyangiaceae bacterium]
MDEQPRLDHERLDVYNAALEFWAFGQRAVARVPVGRKELRDQLERAAMSIPLNIAEASGKSTRPERSRFFSIARGSTLECGAILDVLALAGLLPKDQLTQGKQLLLRIVAMLTKLCR